MSGLDIPTQMAVRDLLKEAYAFVGKKWDGFAKILNEGATDKTFNEDASVLEEMTRTKKKDGVERPRKVISKRFAFKLFAFCKAESGFTISNELMQKLESLCESLATSQGKANLPDAEPPGGFIPALGLTEDVATRSINPERQMTELLITGLHHDLSRKRSFAHFQWKNDPEKHLSLDVPFECTLDRLPKEARKAIEAFSEELALATIATPP